MSTRIKLSAFLVIFTFCNTCIGNALSAGPIDSTVCNAICAAADVQEVPGITSDGNGGAIISWKGKQSIIYAQRINDSGTVQWTANGAAINANSAADGYPAITGDGNAGAIIAWKGKQSIIYAQRINGGGVVQWTTGGTAINTNSAADGCPAITGDGNGGAIISWKDQQSIIYAQRINSSGTVQWTANGAAINAKSAADGCPAITGDGNAGAIITWKGQQSIIYAQRINEGGTVLWTANGVAINAKSAEGGCPAVISDRNGGAIISWKDQQSIIYAQRINGSGTVQWTANGTAINAKSAAGGCPAITGDGNAGAIIAWKGQQSIIYAQRINESGTVQWTANGVAILPADSSDTRPYTH